MNSQYLGEAFFSQKVSPLTWVDIGQAISLISQEGSSAMKGTIDDIFERLSVIVNDHPEMEARCVASLTALLATSRHAMLNRDGSIRVLPQRRALHLPSEVVGIFEQQRSNRNSKVLWNAEIDESVEQTLSAPKAKPWTSLCAPVPLLVEPTKRWCTQQFYDTLDGEEPEPEADSAASSKDQNVPMKATAPILPRHLGLYRPRQSPVALRVVLEALYACSIGQPDAAGLISTSSLSVSVARPISEYGGAEAILRSVCRIGTYFKRLKSVVSLVQSLETRIRVGSFGSAELCGVLRVLDDYEKHIHLLHRRRRVPVGCSATHFYRCFAELRPALRTIEAVAVFFHVNESPSWRPKRSLEFFESNEMLSRVFSQSQRSTALVQGARGVAGTIPMLLHNRLLAAALNPFNRLIDCILTQGHLVDPFDEFFIVPSHSLSRNGFVVQASRLPKFISPNHAEELLEALCAVRLLGDRRVTFPPLQQTPGRHWVSLLRPLPQRALPAFFEESAPIFIPRKPLEVSSSQIPEKVLAEPSPAAPSTPTRSLVSESEATSTLEDSLQQMREEAKELARQRIIDEHAKRMRHLEHKGAVTRWKQRRAALAVLRRIALSNEIEEIRLVRALRAARGEKPKEDERLPPSPEASTLPMPSVAPPRGEEPVVSHVLPSVEARPSVAERRETVPIPIVSPKEAQPETSVCSTIITKTKKPCGRKRPCPYHDKGKQKEERPEETDLVALSERAESSSSALAQSRSESANVVASSLPTPIVVDSDNVILAPDPRMKVEWDFVSEYEPVKVVSLELQSPAKASPWEFNDDEAIVATHKALRVDEEVLRFDVSEYGEFFRMLRQHLCRLALRRLISEDDKPLQILLVSLRDVCLMQDAVGSSHLVDTWADAALPSGLQSEELVQVQPLLLVLTKSWDILWSRTPASKIICLTLKADAVLSNEKEIGASPLDLLSHLSIVCTAGQTLFNELWMLPEDFIEQMSLCFFSLLLWRIVERVVSRIAIHAKHSKVREIWLLSNVQRHVFLAVADHCWSSVVLACRTLPKVAEAAMTAGSLNHLQTELALFQARIRSACLLAPTQSATRSTSLKLIRKLEVLYATVTSAAYTRYPPQRVAPLIATALQSFLTTSRSLAEALRQQSGVDDEGLSCAAVARSIDHIVRTL